MNCIFSENDVLYWNGALRSVDAFVDIVNSIFWNDTAGYTPGEIGKHHEIGYGGNGLVTIYSCDVQDGDNGYLPPFDNGNYNINKDPEFINPGFYNFRIPKTSPCVDEAYFDNGPTYDIELNSRAMGTEFDIGAYEYQKTWN